MTMKLTTAAFRHCPEGYLAVRVSQGHGFGRVDAVLPGAMPSPDLLDAYKHGRASWDDYVPEYLRGVEWGREGLRSAVAVLLLRTESDGLEGLCFLCYEASPARCHRRLFHEWLSSGVLEGYDVDFLPAR